jgi:hypothetical protein
MSGYVLVQDESCHWYVIPAKNESEWHRWCENEEAAEAPAWARRVNGPPSLVEFDSFRLNGERVWAE